MRSVATPARRQPTSLSLSPTARRPRLIPTGQEHRWRQMALSPLSQLMARLPLSRATLLLLTTPQLPFHMQRLSKALPPCTRRRSRASFNRIHPPTSLPKPSIYLSLSSIYLHGSRSSCRRPRRHPHRRLRPPPRLCRPRRLRLQCHHRRSSAIPSMGWETALSTTTVPRAKAVVSATVRGVFT